MILNAGRRRRKAAVGVPSDCTLIAARHYAAIAWSCFQADLLLGIEVEVLKGGVKQGSAFESPTHSQNLKYNPALDHVRFLAFFLVFGYHVYGHYLVFGVTKKISVFTAIITEGYTGVSLFFVLSGFLFMSMAMNTDHISYKKFLINRVLRIYPLFLFFFFTAISITRDRFAPTDILYVLFTNIGKPPTSASIIMGAAWTISVEFTFYLVFPFLARFAKQKGSVYLFQLISIMLIVRLVTYAVSEQPTQVYYWTLIGRFDQFLIGMLAAQLSAPFKITPSLARLTLIFSTITTIVMVWVQGRHATLLHVQPRQPFWIVWGVIEAACWAAFVVSYSNARIAWPAPLARWLQRGGELSYSLYLTHVIAITLLLFYVGPLAAGYGNWVLFLGNGALALATTWIVSSLTYRVIEQPFLSMRRRYIDVDRA